jgi:hypothetical protein
MKQAELTISDPDSLRKSMIQENENMEKGLKEFLNPQERFAARMKASLRGS